MWPVALLDLDMSLQRFLRGDQLSYVPTFRPLYWMDLNHDLHHAAESPPTVQPNYNRRYKIWHGVAVYGSGACSTDPAIISASDFITRMKT